MLPSHVATGRILTALTKARMQRIQCVGGVCFTAPDPKALAACYREHQGRLPEGATTVLPPSMLAIEKLQATGPRCGIEIMLFGR